MKGINNSHTQLHTCCIVFKEPISNENAKSAQKLSPSDHILRH